MRNLLFVVICAFFISCSHEKKLARSRKHLTNIIQDFPELISHDTIFKQDTTIVNGVQHDTIFKTTITRDTMIIKDHQLTIKYYNDGKTTYLKGVCDTIKIIKEVPVIVNSVNPITSVYETRWYDWLFRAISLLAILFICFDQLASRRK